MNQNSTLTTHCNRFYVLDFVVEVGVVFQHQVDGCIQSIKSNIAVSD